MQLLNYPSFCQTYDWDCGPSILQSVLLYYGIYVREGELIEISDADKSGTLLEGIYKTLKMYHLEYTAERMDKGKLINYLDQNIPVVLMVQAWSNNITTDWKNNWHDGHFVTLIGYQDDKFFFADPYLPYRVYLTFSELEDRWHDIDTEDKKYYSFGIAVKGKIPTYGQVNMVHMD